MLVSRLHHVVMLHSVYVNISYVLLSHRIPCLRFPHSSPGARSAPTLSRGWLIWFVPWIWGLLWWRASSSIIGRYRTFQLIIASVITAVLRLAWSSAIIRPVGHLLRRWRGMWWEALLITHLEIETGIIVKGGRGHAIRASRGTPRRTLLRL